ncbi:PqqD family protein [Candidatus Calescamantes bacterium]|nr:PqqD family protein [Candidatus Calescamantes bacterium]
MRNPKRPVINRKILLQAKPLRNTFVTWEEDGDELYLNIPLKQVKLSKLWRFLFGLPEKKRIHLDILGTEVWKMCNGENTVRDIVKSIQERYNLSRKEAEVSTLEYLRKLMARHLIGLKIKEGGI